MPYIFYALLFVACKEKQIENSEINNTDSISNSSTTDLIYKTEPLKKEEITILVNVLLNTEYLSYDEILADYIDVQQSLNAAYDMYSLNPSETGKLKINEYHKIISYFENQINALEAYKSTLSDKLSLAQIQKDIIAINVILGKGHL